MRILNASNGQKFGMLSRVSAKCRFVIFMLAWLTGLSASAQVSAGKMSEWRNHQPFSVAKSGLELCGTGDLVAFYIFDVGRAKIYREDCQRPWSTANPEIRYMEFEYLREIPGAAFKKAAEYWLEKNGVSLSESTQRFNHAYQDIGKGDRYQLWLNPDKGLVLGLNGHRLAEIDDPVAGARYFSIWLGEKPFDRDLKNELLGPAAK